MKITPLLPRLSLGALIFLSTVALPVRRARAQSYPTIPTWALSYGLGSYDGSGQPTADDEYFSGLDFPTGIAPMPDGGVVVAGVLAFPMNALNSVAGIDHAGSHPTATLVRYAASGNIMWQRALSDSYPGQTIPASSTGQVLTDTQGNVFVNLTLSDVSTSDTKPSVAKFSADGALFWENTITNTDYQPPGDPAPPVVQGGLSAASSLGFTSDGGLLLAFGGGVLPPSGANAVVSSPCIAKFNADGSLAFFYPFYSGQVSGATAACQSHDGTHYLMLVSNHSYATAVLIDASGSPVSEMQYYTDGGDDLPLSVTATADGGYVTLSQLSTEFNLVGSFTLRKLNADLTPAWEKVLSGFIPGAHLTPTADGGFLLCAGAPVQVINDPGYTGGYKAVVLKLDANGEVQNAMAYGGLNGSETIAHNNLGSAFAIPTADGGYAFTTATSSYLTGIDPASTDWWTVKLDDNFRAQVFPDLMVALPASLFAERDNAGIHQATTEVVSALANFAGAETYGHQAVVLSDPSTNAAPNAPSQEVEANPVSLPVLPATTNLQIATILPPETGTVWTFTATQPATVAGIVVRVQYSYTPEIESSWTELPGGTQMTRSTTDPTQWTLVTQTIPVMQNPSGPDYLNEAFRAVASVAGYADSVTPLSDLYAVSPSTYPVFSNSPDAPVATVGQSYSYRLVIISREDSLSNADPAPPGLSYSESSGGDILVEDLSGTPTQAGTFVLHFTATDANGTRSTTETVTLTVQPAPAISSPLTATATEGQPFTYQITVSDLTATSYTADGLPDWLDYSISTGIISGTPPVGSAGSYPVQISTSDAANDTITGTLVITVNAAVIPPPTPPPATPSPTPTNSPTPTPTPAGPTSDLTLTLGESPAQVDQNGNVTYNFTVVNHGPNPATDVRVVITKDANESFVSQGSTTLTVGDNGLYTVDVANLDASGAGATANFTVVFRANAGGTISLSAMAYQDNTDPNPADNTATLAINVNPGTPAAHAPTINAPAGGVILVGEPFAYQITTLGDVAVDSYGATGLPDGLSVDTGTGVISGTVADDDTLGTVTVTLSASNGAGRSTSTRTFTVTASPTGKTPDVFGTLTGLKIKAPAGDGTTGKYKVSGSYSLANQGRKPAKNVSVGLYLSNSPDFSFPAVAADPSVSQVAIFLNTSNPTNPVLSLTPAGSTAMTAILPFPLAKKGAAGSTLGPVPFAFKIAAKRVNSALAKYRYLLVVIDPADTLKESVKSNNVSVIDLQSQTQ